MTMPCCCAEAVTFILQQDFVQQHFYGLCLLYGTAVWLCKPGLLHAGHWWLRTNLLAAGTKRFPSCKVASMSGRELAGRFHKESCDACHGTVAKIQDNLAITLHNASQQIWACSLQQLDVWSANECLMTWPLVQAIGWRAPSKQTMKHLCPALLPFMFCRWACLLSFVMSALFLVLCAPICRVYLIVIMKRKNIHSLYNAIG